MRLFFYYDRCRRPRFTAALALALPFSFAKAQQLDTARALSALRDARAACESDAGALWGRSLCGPIALVDRQTRLPSMAPRSYAATSARSVTQYASEMSHTCPNCSGELVARPRRRSP
ncbi:MAG: DUF1272 domain-containing protein [Gemmatimonadaceae bacterium]